MPAACQLELDPNANSLLLRACLSVLGPIHHNQAAMESPVTIVKLTSLIIKGILGSRRLVLEEIGKRRCGPPQGFSSYVQGH